MGMASQGGRTTEGEWGLNRQRRAHAAARRQGPAGAGAPVMGVASQRGRIAEGVSGRHRQRCAHAVRVGEARS
jgi:hypothetical protein